MYRCIYTIKKKLFVSYADAGKNKIKNLIAVLSFHLFCYFLPVK